jgi:hypothetical protein
MNAKEIGSFLREGIIPIAVERDVCIHCVHHVAKPSRDNDAKVHWSDLDFQYLGFGSSEIQNAFRAVNILLPHTRNENGSEHEQTFRLILSKRGSRAGALDPAGQATNNVYLTQSREGLCWLQIDKPEQAQKAQRGRPQSFNVDDLINEMGDEPASAPKLCKRMRDQTGMSSATFYRLFSEAKKSGKITCQNDLYSKANPF